MNKKLFFLIVMLAFYSQVMAQGFRVYKDGVVIGTYNVEKFDSISFFLKTAYSAIDLGLPSGTLWADRNVGATEIWDDGWYVSWGETREKPEYGIPKYQLCVFDDYENFYYTKYTVQDGLTSLKPEDDVATVEMGTEWCIPTQSDWEELMTYCTWQWATSHPGEKDGYAIIGPNGHGLFLPAAGRKDGSDFSWGNNMGCYWTKDRGPLLSGKEIYAYELYFGNDFKKIANANRDCGITVRGIIRK